jgi:hypothetical protein
MMESPHAKKRKINQLQRRIDEMHQCQGKEFLDEVRNAYIVLEDEYFK